MFWTVGLDPYSLAGRGPGSFGIGASLTGLAALLLFDASGQKMTIYLCKSAMFSRATCSQTQIICASGSSYMGNECSFPRCQALIKCFQ